MDGLVCPRRPLTVINSSGIVVFGHRYGWMHQVVCCNAHWTIFRVLTRSLLVIFAEYFLVVESAFSTTTLHIMTTSNTMIHPTTGLPIRQSSSSSPPPPPLTPVSLGSSSNLSSFNRIANELETLALTHGMVERQQKSKSRNKLQPRHSLQFSSPSLFDRLARVVCRVMVLPRKELFETWAMALYVHRTFLSSSSTAEASDTEEDESTTTITRIADVACSHGLLSWALLLLARYDEVTGEALEEHEGTIQRSVVCIDLHMPKSAEKLAEAILNEWPHLENYWDYVEGPLEALIPSPGTLLVGIHACDLLSDKMVSHTIQGGCSLALVPCCHSKKSLSIDQKSQWSSEGGTPLYYTLADFVDYFRIHRLEAAGFEVQQAIIPKEFTPKNRILLAKPRNSAAKLGTEHSGPQSLRSKDHYSSSGDREVPDWAKPKFMIPLADTPHDRAVVRALAGREASNSRHHPERPARAVHVSLFLPPDNIQLSALDLEPTLPVEGSLVEALCPEPYLHPTEGRYVRTFKVTFPQEASKMQCRDYCKLMRDRIPEMIPGASVRY
jgi:hypothetical protein